MTKHALREELDASLAQAPLFVIALASLVMLRSPRRVFQQGQLDRLRLSRMFLARSVIWKPLGKLPEGIIQLPELPLQGAVGRFKPPGFWDAFEMLPIRLVAHGILGKRCLVIFHGQGIPVKPNHRRMASQRSLPIQFPSRDFGRSQAGLSAAGDESHRKCGATVPGCAVSRFPSPTLPQGLGGDRPVCGAPNAAGRRNRLQSARGRVSLPANSSPARAGT